MWTRKGFVTLGFGVVSLTGLFTYATTRQEMGNTVVSYPMVPVKGECPVNHNNNNNNNNNNTNKGGCPVNHNDNANGGCPVNHTNNNNNINVNNSTSGGCPVNHTTTTATTNNNTTTNASVGGCPTGGCPVNHTNNNNINANDKNVPSHGSESNSLVPTNQMPPPNQQPHADQRLPLPTQRLKSSIPKVDGNNWEYPSEQMFYNALKRKGWEGYSEKDMKGIVSVHNVTNERCWAEILRWELTLHELKEDPKLVRFRGNYEKISPKAYMKMLFGGVQRPFDRHDWIISRDGQEIRYVIDFYEGAKMEGKASTIHLDIRPALDSPSALLDRVRMYFGVTKDVHQVISERANKKQS